MLDKIRMLFERPNPVDRGIGPKITSLEREHLEKQLANLEKERNLLISLVKPQSVPVPDPVNETKQPWTFSYLLNKGRDFALIVRQGLAALSKFLCVTLCIYFMYNYQSYSIVYIPEIVKSPFVQAFIGGFINAILDRIQGVGVLIMAIPMCVVITSFLTVSRVLSVASVMISVFFNIIGIWVMYIKGVLQNEIMRLGPFATIFSNQSFDTKATAFIHMFNLETVKLYSSHSNDPQLSVFVTDWVHSHWVSVMEPIKNMRASDLQVYAQKVMTNIEKAWLDSIKQPGKSPSIPQENHPTISDFIYQGYCWVWEHPKVVFCVGIAAGAYFLYKYLGPDRKAEIITDLSKNAEKMSQVQTDTIKTTMEATQAITNTMTESQGILAASTTQMSQDIITLKGAVDALVNSIANDKVILTEQGNITIQNIAALVTSRDLMQRDLAQHNAWLRILSETFSQLNVDDLKALKNQPYGGLLEHIQMGLHNLQTETGNGLARLNFRVEELEKKTKGGDSAALGALEPPVERIAVDNATIENTISRIIQNKAQEMDEAFKGALDTITVNAAETVTKSVAEAKAIMLNSHAVNKRLDTADVDKLRRLDATASNLRDEMSKIKNRYTKDIDRHMSGAMEQHIKPTKIQYEKMFNRLHDEFKALIETAKLRLDADISALEALTLKYSGTPDLIAAFSVRLDAVETKMVELAEQVSNQKELYATLGLQHRMQTAPMYNTQGRHHNLLTGLSKYIPDPPM